MIAAKSHQRWAAAFSAVATSCALAWNPPNSIAATCSASYTINLTVELSPELTSRKANLLIELRKGPVGSSLVVDKKEFVGSRATVMFSRLCTGSYFIDIGNGDQ